MTNPYYVDDINSNSVYAQAALGGANLIGGWAGMANESAGYPQAPMAGSYNPSYYNGVFNTPNPHKASGGEILGGAAKGAATGTLIAPGIGTAIGAVVGAAGTVFAGNRRYHRQIGEQNRALGAVESSQNSYNTSSLYNSDQQIASSEYRRRLNQ